MSAWLLRVIACFAMLLDHLGYTDNILPLRAVGRIAFPIFAFLIGNGYRHTSNRLHYALRLAMFAVISQIPFSLFCTNTATHLNGNVYVTLLVALLCIWATDWLWHQKILKYLSPLPVILICLLYCLGLLTSDYGARGVLLAMIFFLFAGRRAGDRTCMFLGSLLIVFYNPLLILLLQLIRGNGIALPQMTSWNWMQLYSLFALPLIFLYNGKKGPVPGNRLLGKLMQYGFYWFYPVHLLILWFLRMI